MMDKAKVLREKLAGDLPVRLVGAHNGLGARLIERHGFGGVWASGLEISTAHALPDANILTMTEYLAAASEMNDACGLPVVADCDTGYGNSNNVMHMVRKYEAAGIAGVCIEDKKFPKVNSYVPGRQELAPIGEFVGKIMAAKAAQRNPQFVVIARVEALIAGWGRDEALRRAHAYADAGADLVLMHSKAGTDEEIREFLARWQRRLPVVIVPTTYPRIELAELCALGVKMVIYANHGIRAAIRSMDAVFERISGPEGIAALEPGEIAEMSTVFDLQGMTQMKQVEKTYLTRDQAVILAAGGPNHASLEPVLGDRPAAMVDINGKSLLQRNVEAVNACGIQRVTVVAGYKGESVNLEGVEVVRNGQYADTGSAASLMLADTAGAERVLVLYGDVIVDRHLLRALMETGGDVVLAVDDAFLRGAGGDRNLDLVVLRRRDDIGVRRVDASSLEDVSAAGRGVTGERGTHEFVGAALFSRKALREARSICAARAESAAWALPDLVEALIEGGTDVKALPVNRGWKEIHTFEHYREAARILQ